MRTSGTLSLPGARIESAAAQPEAPAPAPAPDPAPEKKAKPRFTPRHAQSREFTFADRSRQITIVKHSVRFFCALKEEPETQTLVSISGGRGPVPLLISYADFKTWFEA